MLSNRIIVALLFCFVALSGLAQSPVFSPAGCSGYPCVVASQNLTGQTANLANTTLYTVPSGRSGLYRVSCYAVVTSAAATSSTLPNCKLANWTDPDTGFAANNVNITSNSTANTVGSFVAGVNVVNAAAGTTIQWATVNFASVGAMAYAAHIRLDYLGP